GVHVLILNVAELGRAFLSIELVQQRLRIESLQMRWAAGHKQKDDRLGLGLLRHVRRLGSERIVLRGARIVLRHHGSESERAKPAETVREKLTAVAVIPNMFTHINSHTETH